MSADVFRIGLIGAGRMGRTHLRAPAGSRVGTVAAIVDPVEARVASGGPSTRGYQRVDQLLDSGGIDGVLIAAPSDRHAEIVEAVAAAGIPILCEKPCGVSDDEIRRAAAAARRHGVPLQVAYWRRYVPSLMALREG